MLLEQIIGIPAKPVGEKRMTFRGLDWQTFRQIRSLIASHTRPRFNYDNGVLEITMPLESHERSARLIELFIRILVVELGMMIKTMGSTTLEREDMLKSAEPDNGYYIQNYERVADKTVDLEVDPAPDLVVEVDITHTDLNKNVLYAGIGVSEFWRFNGRVWTIFKLVDRGYVECDRSPTFPMIEKTKFYEFLEAAFHNEVAAEINFRHWVRQQVQKI